MGAALDAPRLTVPSRWKPAPSSKRFYVLMGFLAAVGPVAMDLYVTALPAVAADFDIPTSSAQLTISLYLIGQALGQFVFGLLSDVLGRRKPLLIGLTLFVIGSLICAVSDSIFALCVGRLIQGFAGATGMSIARAVGRDLFGITEAARYYSRLALIYGVAPMLAPVAGAQILALSSWQGIFVALAVLGVLMAAAAGIWLPETLPPEARRPGTARGTIRAFHVLLRRKRFIGCGLTLGLTTGSLVAYIATGPFIVQDGYGASAKLFGVLFGLNALAMVVGAQVNAHLLHRFAPSHLIALGLGLLSAGAIGVIAVGVAGWGLIPLEVFFCMMLSSWGFVQANTIAIALADQGPALAGAGSALLGLTQWAIGGAMAPLAGIGGGTSSTQLGIISLIAALLAVASLLTMVSSRRPPVPEAVVSQA